jgi:hypothetical protein
MQPRWNELAVFAFNRPVTLVVSHKATLIKDSEIGRCSIDPSQMQVTDWVELTNGNRVVGTLLVSVQWLKVDEAGPTVKSGELQEDYLRKINELALQREELEFYKRKYRLKLQRLKHERKSFRVPGDSRGESSTRHYVQTEPCELESESPRYSIEDEFAYVSPSRLKLMNDQKRLELHKQELNSERNKLKALRHRMEVQKTMMDTGLASLCEDCRSRQSGRRSLKSISENRARSPKKVEERKTRVKLQMLNI